MRAGDLVRSVWPNSYVTLGHKILGKCREYERGVTGAINASVQPVLDRYISRLARELKDKRFANELFVMQGNGGTVSSDIVAETAVNTVMSGPASGVIAAAYVGGIAGYPNLITYDMGGTSSDVSIVRNGKPRISSELELEYAMPVHVPMVDVHTIGAGGGSVAFINNGGLLQVGPESAGATPGPISYSRGGQRPTITDANLILGRLSPVGLFSVQNAPSVQTISDIFEEQLGAPLGMNGQHAALAVLRIANERMANAIRLVSLSRGYDPRDFALFAFGGAGPLHAVALAREIGIPKVIIPARPGLTNALGCLLADLRHDFVQTLNLPLAAVTNARLSGVIATQTELARKAIARNAVGVNSIEFLYSAEMQYQGQSHVLSFEFPTNSPSVDELGALFEEAFFRRFDLRLPEMRPVVVAIHTAAIGRRGKPALEWLVERTSSRAGAKPPETRRVLFDDGWYDAAVHRRDALAVGSKWHGPAIIEQSDTTVVMDSASSATIDKFGNLIISLIDL